MSAVSLRDTSGRQARPNLAGPAPQLPDDGDGLLPPRAEASGTLRRMLLSALVRFGDRGYHAVPVRDIARGAGVRASSMYEHRASKEELLADLMVIGHEEHNAWLARARDQSGPDPVDQIAAITRAHVRFHATYPLLARVCNRELGALSADRLEPVLAVRNGTVRIITDAIERGRRDGIFDIDDTYLAAAAIGAMGIRVAEWYAPESGVRIDDIGDTYARFALRMLGCADEAKVLRAQ